MKIKQNVFIALLFFLSLLFSSAVISQETPLYIPVDIQKAYDSGTRSIDGSPGMNYWQNHSNYDITVRVDPATKILDGTETIEYFNNSPDTLYSLVIRLYQEIFKKEGLRDFIVKPDALNDGVYIKKILLDGVLVNISERTYRERPTIMQIFLQEHLPPTQSIKVEIEWSFEIPSLRKIRMGAYSESALFIGYWYPQISVYDDIDGWDYTEYHGRAEFYNDFNNYNVEIEAPADYVVWATGEQQNYKEVFHREILKKITKAKASDEVINILSVENYEDNEVTIGNEWNMWKFKAKDVPDFAFALSNNYIWDAVSLEVDTISKRRVFISSIYPDSVTSYKDVTLFSWESIKSLSTVLPGIPFPYPNFTTFCNGKSGGGMEFPMMANNGAPSQRYRSIGLTAHEIAHTYFPFHMGINERKYAFMEEGMASFFPHLIVKDLEPTDDYLARRVDSFNGKAGLEQELPPITPNYIMTNSPYYRTATYDRPAVAYFLLYEYLGEVKMQDAFKLYNKRWAGKHPLPYDFFFTFNEAADENLNWFWKPWFFEFGYPDLAIKNVSHSNNDASITIERKGILPTPVNIKLVFDDGATENIYKPMSVWKNNVSEITLHVNNEKEIKKVVLGDPHIPDVFPENNLLEF